jgi:hypothetical protein
MDPPKQTFSSGQCHIQIANAMEIGDAIDNIDDRGFERIKAALLHSVEKMARKQESVQLTLTIPPSRCLHIDDWQTMLEILQRHPQIKVRSIKYNLARKDRIEATHKDGLSTLVVKICGANAFHVKPLPKDDDSFETVEDLTQQLKQCEVFAFKRPSKAVGRFRGRLNQPY